MSAGRKRCPIDSRAHIAERPWQTDHDRLADQEMSDVEFHHFRDRCYRPDIRCRQPVSRMAFEAERSGMSRRRHQPPQLARIVEMFRVAAGVQLDPIRAQVDPHLGANMGAGWGRDRVSFSASAGTSLSLVGGSNSGTFNNANGSLGAAYRIGAALSTDCGVRGAYQSYGGQAVLPFTWAAFLGVTLGGSVPLNGVKR